MAKSSAVGQAHPFGWPQPSTPGAIDRRIKDTPDRVGFDITGHRHEREQSASRLQMNVLLAVAEFERDAIIERINAGLAAARDRGVKLGRPRTLDRRRADVAKLMKRGLSGRKIANRLKIPVGSVFAVMRAVDRSAA